MTRAVLGDALATYVPTRGQAAETATGVYEAAIIDAGAIARLRDIVAAGNDGLVNRVLQQFLVDGETLVNDIARGVVAHQNEAVRQAAHTLKSSSAYLGADRLRTCCVRMEQAAVNNDQATQNGLIGALRVEYVRTATALVAMLGAATPA